MRTASMLFTWTRGDLLYLPPLCAFLSLVYIAGKLLWTSPSKRDRKNGSLSTENQGPTDPAGQKSLGETVEKLDGFAILLFRLLQLLILLALLSLNIFELSSGHQISAQIFQTPLIIYISVLAIASMSASPGWRDVASFHLDLLLFVNCFVYFFLDVWPYAKINPEPFDSPAKPATWIRVVLLALAGIIIPLVISRPFRPTGPDDEPSEAETASLLSRFFYSYMDRIVFYAYRVPDITVKDMPHVPESGKIEKLGKRALAALDPVQVGKRYIAWGVLRVWAKDYAAMSIFFALYSIAEFLEPFGLRNLLYSLESGVESHDLRLWAWISLLVIGPLISGRLFTQFLFVSSRVIVENQSVLSYLVFHHSLRIRLKSDALDSDAKKDKAKDEFKSTDESTTSSTPATADVDSAVSGEATEADSDSYASAADAKPVPKGGHAQEKTGHIIGKINNLITSDLTAVGNLYWITTIPGLIGQLIFSVIYLYKLLGWSSFVGFGLMLICLPAPVFIGKSMANAQKAKMQATDKRVQTVTEGLGVIRMVKLFGWEPYMLKQLSHRRDGELAELRRFRVLSTVMDIVNAALPLLSKITVISFYSLASKGGIEASRIFSGLLIYRLLEGQLQLLMSTIPTLLQAKVSCDRYSQFLNTTELLSETSVLAPDAEERISSDIVVPERPADDIIGFKKCSFSWDSPNKGESTPSRAHYTRKHFKLCFDDEVFFNRGQINLIVGPTASGKTSVLMALLGEMYCNPQGLGSWYNLPRGDGIAYAPQETWVLNETIKDNILFGETYNEERYKKVLYQCALEKDLAMWEAGDLTEVGEKGLTLSGGQKARVTLARALYSSASILLLDDILAALDVHTAKWVFDKGLQGDLIKGRTVLLVTHNIALAAPVAGHVLVLGRHGTVSAQGTVSDVLKTDSRLRAQVEKEQGFDEDVEGKLEEGRKDDDKDKDDKKAAGKLVVAEEKAMGRVEAAAIMLYVQSVGGPFTWTLILGLRFLGFVGMCLQDWIIGYWSSQYDTHAPSEVPASKYLKLFILVSVGAAFSDGTSQFLWVFKTLRASKVIHSRLLQSVFKSSFRWLDITPVGRIVTRCTQDMSTIDEQLSMFANIFLSVTISLVCLFSSSVLMAGWYALISGLIVLISATSLGRVYLKCQMSTRREMSNSKAPVMSQVGTALSGLPSIRAYGAQNIFYSELKKRIDVLARTSFCFYDINRWVTIRMDVLGAVFSGVVAAYLVYGSHISSGLTGFTLSVVLSFSRQILYWVRFYNLVEIQANSLERMLEFMRIEHEPEPSESGKPPAYWPSSGELHVENLSARYSDDSPTILRNIEFSVESGQRVGIVGRTGAGKSSIALALLRAIKTEGKVYYDGLATDEINLDALRANITLIPQQPELIHGTLRENLDPFGQHDDAMLYDALNASGFFSIKDLATNPQPSGSEDANGSSVVESGAGPDASGKIGLDTMVESGGTNFSLGQRQIIALARAIIRRSKLLILDEATAAIDYETDTAIQKTLRNEFSKDTTLLTIAHRLHTIMDYDKIMVLDAGELVEFDSPRNLLKIDGGHFRALIDESDDREALLGLLEG